MENSSRKLRVTYFDPEATDSSSDEKSQKKSARKVHEIILPKEKILKNLAKNEAFSPKRHFVGVRRRRSGKYSSEIKDPFMKKKVYLGTFTTPEEASRAFLAKKREIRKKLRAKQGVNSISRGKSEPSEQKSPTSVLEIESSNFGFLCGVQIVDENGFLVGDFGKIDDLSICTVGDGNFLPGYEFWGKGVRH